MKLAFIPPVSMLSYTHKTDYQLMLPQLCNIPEYERVYEEHCRNKNQFVILDNGAAEEFECSWTDLVDLAYAFEPNEVVLPDTLGDKQDTIKKAEEFRRFFLHGSPLSSVQVWSDFRWMFVVQGQTFEEVVECGTWAAAQDWIDTIGIPRHLVSSLDTLMARTKISNELTRIGSDKELHFLGANPNLCTEMATLASSGVTNPAYVRGMDTSMPFNYAFKSKYGIGTYLQPNAKAVHRPQDYFHLKEEHFDADVLKWNVERTIEWSQGKKPLYR